MAVIKQGHQSCDHLTVGRYLPPFLLVVDDAESAIDPGARHGYRAQAFHTAATLLFKLGKNDLARTAAHTSMAAARRSRRPLDVCRTGRVMVDAITSDEGSTAAFHFASELTAELESGAPSGAWSDPVWLSNYGLLVLRGAMAASRAGLAERSDLWLTEAGSVARVLSDGSNHDWTAFGPANVLAHRVAAEANLGNAGRSVEAFQRLALDRLGTAERKATVLVDAGRSYLTWGRYLAAVDCFSDAQRLAPQDFCSRPVIKDAIERMLVSGPRSTRRRTEELARRADLLRQTDHP